MTKLDEAIIAAAEAYFQEPCDDLDEEIADNFRAAIQAAVKVLVPDGLAIGADYYDLLVYDPQELGEVDGHNACRAEILKNAGVD